MIKALILIFLIPLTYAKSLEVEGQISEDLELSAISCLSNKLCLLASDETNHLQSFKIINNKLVVSNKEIKLGKFENENDIEGLTHDGVYFYAIGSHGLSKKAGRFHQSRYKLFQLLIGKAGDLLELNELPLSQLLSIHPKLKKYYKKELNKNGINIEGLAYERGSLYIGFRAPLIEGRAQILRVSLKDFSLNASELFSIDLEGEGIRSLEFFKGGLYGASGASLPGAKQISSFFKADLNTLKVKSREVPYLESKLEGFEFLNDEETLLIYDSEKDGMPTIFKPAL
ncbi:MAG: DUF3616 domain-containing protein [Bdellovibrionota bacterium]|nr:DUF3616 domain-containing protein [Bdellovibrionota bacterium]